MNYYDLLIKRSRSVEPPAPAIPTDYVFYAPLSDYTASTDATGRALSYGGEIENITIDGVPCIQFNNSGGHVATSDYTNLPTGKHVLTQSIWYYNTEMQNRQSALMCFGYPNRYGSIHLYKMANQHVRCGGWFLDYDPTYVFEYNKWYHLCQTYDGETFRFYVNGVLTDSSTNSNVNIQSGGVSIGANVNSSNDGGGYALASARIYDRVLTLDEIQALADEFNDGIPTDYVFYASLKSASATTAETGQALTYSATPVELTSDGIDCLNCKLVKITTDDMTGMPTGNHSFTFGIWFRVPNLSTLMYHSVMVFGSNRSYDYPHIGFDKISRMWFNFIESSWNNSHQVSSSWSHLLGTYDATTRKRSLYLDGVLIGENTLPADANISSTGQIIINFDDNYNTDLYLASARIYDRVLTTDEIYALANEFSATTEIVFNDQSATFISGRSNSVTLTTVPTGCTFSTTDTLPSGVTLSSSGVLSYDGTAFQQDATVTVSVTASKSGYTSATATVTISMIAQISTVRFGAGVDTTLYITNTNGVFVATPNGDWGGTGYHDGIKGTWVSFYPKHGVKYSLDGGTTYLDWCFEDTNSTLDLSSLGTTITSVTKVSGRDMVSLSGQKITVNDPSSSSAIYVFDVEMS